jgi:Cu(I)/Ag(I) efflux system protein CusF
MTTNSERIIMKNFKLLITISTLILGTSTVFAASHAGAPMAKGDAKKAMPMAASADMAEGEVRKVDKENKKITLKHGVIKNLDMPGMTMIFGIKDAAILDNLKAGDKVKFKAEQAGSAIVVTDIQPAK